MVELLFHLIRNVYIYKIRILYKLAIHYICTAHPVLALTLFISKTCC